MVAELRYFIDQLVEREDLQLRLKLTAFKFMLDGQVGLLELKIKRNYGRR